jgi:hypothetical protein
MANDNVCRSKLNRTHTHRQRENRELASFRQNKYLGQSFPALGDERKYRAIFSKAIKVR